MLQGSRNGRDEGNPVRTGTPPIDENSQEFQVYDEHLHSGEVGEQLLIVSASNQAEVFQLQQQVAKVRV